MIYLAYNAKNYHAHGGEEFVVGGKMTFLEGATVEGLNAAINCPEYTQMPNQADSTASTIAALVVDFNALLTKLKTAGLMAADASEE